MAHNALKDEFVSVSSLALLSPVVETQPFSADRTARVDFFLRSGRETTVDLAITSQDPTTYEDNKWDRHPVQR